MVQNLELYRTFYYVANLGSFSATADALFITQSAVSQSIKKLEGELDCRLFERNRNPISLTPEGELLMKHVKNAFADLQQGEQELKHKKASREQVLNLGATQLVLYYGLPQKIQQLQQTHPNLKVNLCGFTTPELISMLRDGSLEAAFMILPPTLDNQRLLQNMRVTSIAKVQDYPVASPKLGLSPHKIYTLEELMKYPFISHNERNAVRKIFSQWFLQNGFVFDPQFNVSNTSEALKMVEFGLGIGILPRPIIADAQDRAQLTILNMDNLPAPRELLLVRRPNIQSPLISELENWY